MIRIINLISDRVSRLADWCVLAAVGISAANALVRYSLNWSSNALLEIQGVLFAAVVMLGAAQTLRLNGHVRVDILYVLCSPRRRLWLDAIGMVVILLPVTAYLAWLCIPFAFNTVSSGEVSLSPGGLPLWPIRVLLAAGFVLLFAQGVAELLRRVLALRGNVVVETTYEKPLQ
jgi:TRAP-type mannitol/chloroaromatic compound transport system permease small subunit